MPPLCCRRGRNSGRSRDIGAVVNREGTGTPLRASRPTVPPDERKDLTNPNIVAALDEYGCRLLFKFADGLAHVRARLRTGSGP